MTIDVLAIRGDGDKDGGEIFDPLLCVTEAALGRAAQEINASTPVNPVTLDVVYRPGIRRGQLVEVNDSFTGVSWKGIIISVNHVVSGPVVHTNLTLERAAS